MFFFSSSSKRYSIFCWGKSTMPMCIPSILNFSFFFHWKSDKGKLSQNLKHFSGISDLSSPWNKKTHTYTCIFVFLFLTNKYIPSTFYIILESRRRKYLPYKNTNILCVGSTPNPFQHHLSHLDSVNAFNALALPICNRINAYLNECLYINTFIPIELTRVCDVYFK